MIHEWKRYVYVTDLRDINGLHGREVETEYLGHHESHHKPLKKEKIALRCIELTEHFFLLVDGKC